MAQSRIERPEPPEENLARVGSQTFETHVKRGLAILKVLERKIKKYGAPIEKDSHVYDFGCGIGRVAIPLSEKFDANIYTSDVDPTAIEFLKENFSHKLKAFVNNYEPPLPFEDKTFDVIYSISVWSHLPAHLQIKWLSEMRRIIKTEGILLISTAGISHLENWHAKGKRLDISTAKLCSERQLFIRNHRIEKNPDLFPGVTGDWGVYYQTPEHIKNLWSNYLKIEEIDEASIGRQDLVVLRKSN